MIPYRPNRLTAVPRTLEVRLEIMKAIRTLAAQDEDGLIRRDGPDIAGVRSYVRKFDPDQPRVAAGNQNGGQWTGGEANGQGQSATRLAARRISPALLAECEEQYERDLEECRMVGLSTCYQQAILRRSNCERGLQIPPLNY